MDSLRLVSRRRALGGFLLGATLLMAASLAAGEKERKPAPYALIFGTVWDPDSHPVYGICVKVRRFDQKKPQWELYSDHNGEFAQRVPVGPADYLVWAEPGGSKSSNPNNLRAGKPVRVRIEGDERVDLGLHLIK
jgi:hypothetical protein